MHEIEKIINACNYEIVIKWKDGKTQALTAGFLQSRCACVECMDCRKEPAGDLKILSFMVKGRLGLKIQFSAGCQKGIYSFTQIRSWLKS